MIGGNYLDIKDKIINKLALKIAQLEVDKANILTQLEIAKEEIDELKQNLITNE